MLRAPEATVDGGVQFRKIRSSGTNTTLWVPTAEYARENGMSSVPVPMQCRLSEIRHQLRITQYKAPNMPTNVLVYRACISCLLGSR